MSPLRTHQSYLSSIGHRLSGIGLVMFLPVHFWLLGNAFSGAEGLDALLVYTDLLPVKIAEWGLVILLALHLFFGLRLLALEFTTLSNRSSLLVSWIMPGAICTLLIGAVFIFQLF